MTNAESLFGETSFASPGKTPPQREVRDRGAFRVVRVLPNEPGISKTFDYALYDATRGSEFVEIGTMVRFVLNGRHMGGWISGIGVPLSSGHELKPITKVSSRGPSREVLSLSKWAASRWWSRPVKFLVTASPQQNVALSAKTALIKQPRVQVDARPELVELFEHASSASIADGAKHCPVLVRIGPCVVHSDIVLAVLATRLQASPNELDSLSVLVLAPTIDSVNEIVLRLRRSGIRVAKYPFDWQSCNEGGCVIVGTRSAAWAPTPGLDCVIVLDESNEGYAQQQSPNWNAREVVIERGARADAPVFLVSSAASVDSSYSYKTLSANRSSIRSAWPKVQIIDRSNEPPHRVGLVSPLLTPLLRSNSIVACILNTKGRSALMACAKCGSICECERCHGAVVPVTSQEVVTSVDEKDLVESELILECKRCGFQRPQVCMKCGSVTLKNIRMGISRAVSDIATLAQREVVEVHGESDSHFDARILVGTQALLHRSGRVDAVVFLDFDSELMAPRFRSSEQSFELLVLAARLIDTNINPHSRIYVQTRSSDHLVIQSAITADPQRLVDYELSVREELHLPPYSSLARISGAGSQELVEQMIVLNEKETQRSQRLQIVPSAQGDSHLIKSPSFDVLCQVLSQLERTSGPGGRVKLEFDPQR